MLVFLRRQRWLLLLWAAGALGLAAAWWDHAARDIRHAQRDHAAALERQVDAFMQNLVIRTQRSVAECDRLLRLVRHGWGRPGQRNGLAGTLESGIFSREYISAILIIDRHGVVTSSTHPRAVGMDVGAFAFFTAQRASGADQLQLSAPFDGELTGREVVAFSRPLLTSGGSFDGLVVITVLPAFFTQHYAAPTMGSHGFVAVMDANGAILASRSGSTIHSYKKPFLLASPLVHAPEGTEWLDGRAWFADGRTRVGAWRRFHVPALAAVVALDESAAMARFREVREARLRVTRAGIAALLLAALAGAGLHVHARWRRHQVESLRATYRLATENAGDGFFINRPVRDRDGVVRDFSVVDCNQHGAAMFGKRPDELIGHRLSEFYQGALFRKSCERLCKALDSGIYERELPVSPGLDQPLQARWIRYKAVRDGSDLAVTIRDISESKAYLTELERRSNSDALTGLPNRFWIQHYLPRAIAAACAAGQGMAVLFIDLDGFKTVNDALGHAAGDDLLRTVGTRLKMAVRPGDHVVRLGGDEFVVVLEQVAGPDDVAQAARQLLSAFRDGFQLQNATHVLGASIGIALFPEHGSDAQTLLKHADIAMYAVKTEGKGRFCFFQPRFFEAIRGRLETEMQLRQALDRCQFVVHYQPRVDLRTGAVCAMEALVRWERPGQGLTGPAGFIGLLEETGLIVRLGEQVIDGVCRQLASWARAGADLVPVSVNISPRQFSQSDVMAQFRSAIARHGVNPALLEIEVTESSMMQEGIGESAVFSQLRELGIKLCIDDFGTGYSSLSQLQKLRFDVLKIDRAFILRIAEPEGDTLIASMVAMAHALGMRVVAEGIESQEQMRLLQTLGCDEGQGYFFSRPVPPDACRLPQVRARLEPHS